MPKNGQQTRENQTPTTSSPPCGCRSPLNLLPSAHENTLTDKRVSSCIQPRRVLLPGRRGVTLGKPDIKVETINKETHSLEEDSGSVSTASRMVKAMYSVRSGRVCVSVCVCLGWILFTQPVVVGKNPQINSVTSPCTTLWLLTKDKHHDFSLLISPF